MKKLILAAVLACVPVAASSQDIIVPSDQQQITETELAQRAVVCAALASGQISASDVVTLYNLDTVRKQRDFALQCKMLEVGYIIAKNEGNYT